MVFTFFLFFSFLLPHIAVSSCPISACNSDNPDIRFPFRLTSVQAPSCGFPGFDLSCNSQKQTIITLPSSGDFSVNFINYWQQTLLINDLDSCLTKRFFENDFSLAGSNFLLPFDSLDHFTFLNCSSNNNTVSKDIPPVNCLGDDHVGYMVIAVSTSAVMPPDYYGCSVISTVVASKYLDSGVELAWSEPDCSYCESRGLLCELENVQTSRIRCTSFSKKTGGFSTATRIGIVLGVSILVILFILCFCDWRSSGEPTITELSTITTGQMQFPIPERPLDRRTIESYPKIQLGESLELLPEADNKTCPICLCDYQGKEVVRIVPECNHYFHADCLDAWLRKNPTCPICRNLPKSTVTDDENLCYWHACTMPT